MEQVFMNLVVNARDAMPGGGTIVIRTRALRLATPRREQGVPVPSGDWMVCEVSDTGEGMVPAVVGRIFEPFFTTKPTGQGTGLGLSTVYGIIKQSGGFIFCESAPGRGRSLRALGRPMRIRFIADLPGVIDRARPGSFWWFGVRFEFVREMPGISTASLRAVGSSLVGLVCMLRQLLAGKCATACWRPRGPGSAAARGTSAVVIWFPVCSGTRWALRSSADCRRSCSEVASSDHEGWLAPARAVIASGMV